MNRDDLKKLIDSLTQDVEFDYNGMHGSICPFSRSEIHVRFGEKTREFKSVDAVMDTPFFGGKALGEIADQLSLY